MQTAFDVLIIGGGPGGAFLAHKLAQNNIKTLVLERHLEPKRKVCGEYLCPLGVDLLQREGLEYETIGGFLPLHGMLIVSAQGTEVDTLFPQGDHYHGVAVNREAFDRNLIALAKNSGAEVRVGVEVKKITQASDTWLVETSAGVFRTRILVGADGRGSIVSKTFSNDLATGTRRVALHALAENPQVNLRRGEMHLFANGAYIGINPTGKNEINFSLVIDAEELRALGGPVPAMNHYLEKSTNLRSRFQPFEASAKITAAYPIQHRTKTVIPAHNVALIGDAAGFVDPLTGEGMYNALLSASLLATSLIKSWHSDLRIKKQAFLDYKAIYSRVLAEKVTLNRLFQQLIRRPRLVEVIAWFLKRKQIRADIFIGIIGNIYSPTSGILKLLNTLRGPL